MNLAYEIQATALNIYDGVIHMTEQITPILDNPSVEVVLENRYLKHIIFLTLVALSIIGDLIGDAFPRESRFYWLCLVFVFAFCTFTLEASRVKRLNITSGKVFKIQGVHWGGTLLAVLTIFYLTDQHQISPASAGVIIHIILALATFLTGVYLGWKFYLLGFLLFLLAALAAYDTGFLTYLLLIIIPVIFLGMYLEEYKIMPTLRKK